MSKVSFRARALDVSKPMAIFRADEIPDLRDYDKINRAVLQMPTGMEKEEETETHLQKALTAQQFYGTAEARAIPIPQVQAVDDRYEKLYTPDYKLPRQYIHIQALGMEQEIPDYDLDSEDECWLHEQSKKMEISPNKFEEMMDRLEKGSGQQVVTLGEAKCLLKEDDDLIIAVYDYWLNKRLRLEMPLIPQVKSEKRDGTTTNNPYVAFRRRTEKMQTRKNRKNDETSYEKMLKLKRDMLKAGTLTHILKRREKSKKEALVLAIEILAKRYQMGDFNGTYLAEAEAEQAKMPSTFIAPFMYNNQLTYNGDEVAPVRKKRQYKRRQKQPQQPHHTHAAAAAIATAASFGDLDVIPDLDSSDDDMLSPAMSPSDHEDENDPDGPFAFKRRKHCHYYAPLYDRLGNWPWCPPEEGGKGDKRHRFSLTSLPGGRCIGFARRRVGRGGRVILDRGFTPWDEELEKVDFVSGQSYSGRIGEYITYVRERKFPYYRPQTPPPEQDSSLQDDVKSSHHCSFQYSKSSSPSSEFNLESFNCHREQLLEMQREQAARLMDSDFISSAVSASNLGGSLSGCDLQRSFSSQPTSRFTLDSASAQFAVTAVITDSAQLEETNVLKSENVNCDDGQTQGVSVMVVSDAAVTIPSTSLVMSSLSSCGASTPVSFSLASHQAVMATKALGLSPTVVPLTPVSLSTSSLLSLTSQNAHTVAAPHHISSNGPVSSSSSILPLPAIIHSKPTGLSQSVFLHVPVTSVPRSAANSPAVLPATVPVIPSPLHTPSHVSTLTAGKAANNKLLAASVGATTGLCNLSSSSPIILKPNHEEGNNSVHIFNADTPMAMDVS